MKILCVLIGLLLKFFPAHALEITPYKYTDQEREKGLPPYKVPLASTFTLKRSWADNSEITYYLSKPNRSTFPIAVICGGSSLKEDIVSIIHLHRYFLKEFIDLGVAVLTIEQQGVKADHVNVDEFMAHYTRSARLKDHQAVIDHLRSHPPQGWNGKFVFLGCSEGGPLLQPLPPSIPV